MKKLTSITLAILLATSTLTGCATMGKVEVNGTDVKGNWCTNNPGKCTAAIIGGAALIGWGISEMNDDDDPAPAPAPAPVDGGGGAN